MAAAAAVSLGAFCGAPLDRSTGPEHKEEGWTAKALAAPDTRFLVFSCQKGSTGAAPLLVKQKPLPPAIAWQTAATLQALGVDLESHNCHGVPPVLLGSQGGAQRFSVLVDKSEQELQAVCEVPEEKRDPGVGLFVSDGMMKLMMIGCDAGDFTTVGQAFNRVTWHKQAQFCGKCGGKTESYESGAKRRCTNCGFKVYPRIDPSCMALVRKASGDACLLVRNVGYPPGMWSCVSGFVEQGEQTEEAIVREVREETKVEVDLSKGVDWLGSQPWALGPGGKAELMLCAEVEAKSEELEAKKGEVEEARWFSREEVAMLLQTPWNMEGRPFVPGATSAAHHLLRRFLLRGMGGDGSA